MRTCCFTFRYSQGLAGGVVTGGKWELTTGSSVTVSLLSLPCVQGFVQHSTGLKAQLYVQDSTVEDSTAQARPAPT